MNTETNLEISTLPPKKTASNRANARKSTGPKTAEGKAMSKLNAVKHGLLAQTVLVRGQQFRESAQGFRQLHAEFHASLQPEGPLEEMLVDEIIQATWRLRRARKAESGEIALSVDDGWRQRKDLNPLPRALFLSRSLISTSLAKLEDSSAGCSYLNNCLRKVLLAVDATGKLTEEVMEDFKSAVGNNDLCLLTSVLSHRACRADTGKNEKGETHPPSSDFGAASPPLADADATSPSTPRYDETSKAEVMDIIRNEMHRLLLAEEECERREADEEQTRQTAAILPTSAALERIMRYERALERQLYRAMSQLERLQRRRLGDNVPAPMAIQTTG